MRKHRFAVTIAATVAALSAATALVACGNKGGGTGGGDNTEPVRLDAPVITLTDNVVSWTAVDNASSYSVTVGDGAAVKVTETEYTVTETEVGSYPVYVVAVAAVGGRYTDSQKSNVVTYVVGEPEPDPGDTSLKSLSLVANPVKTEYFLDETSGGGTVDLTGVVVNAVYGNGDRKKVTATVDNVVDMTTAGDKTVWLAYSEDGGDKVKTSFVVSVRERTEADIGGALVKKNYEYSTSVSSYEIADGDVTVVDMKGAPVDVIKEGGKSKISFTGTSTRLYKVTAAGGQTSFVKINAAYYVRTEQDFLNIKNDLSASYVLQNDIVLEGKKEMMNVAPVIRKDDDFKFDKSGYTDWSYPDEGVFEHSGEAGGAPFTGSFDGGGYVISGYELEDASYWQAAAFYRGLFGYIGEGGRVSDFTLRNVKINSGKYSAFVAGVNLGTIENVVIENDCSLHAQYTDGGLVAAYNGGRINNVVSYVNKYTSGYGDRVFTGAANESDEDAAAKNVYVGNTSDLSETLGSGWFYVEGLGTVYGNDSYKKVTAMPTVMYETDDGNVTADISVYQKTQEDIAFIVWIGANSYSDDSSPLKYVSYSAATSTYTVKLELTNLLDAGDKFTLGVKSLATDLFIAVGDVTVGEPYAVDASYSGSPISVMQNTDIVLSTVTLDVKYSDGSVRQVNPVKVEGFNKSGAVGTPQTVKFFYGEGSDEYTEINVNVTAVTGNVVTAISAVKQSGVDKIVISSGATFDIFEYYDITVTYSVDGSKTVAKGDVKLSVSAVASGLNSITLTYLDGASVSTTLTDVAVWQKVKSIDDWRAINDNLSGYYLLTADLDLSTYNADNGLVIGKAPVIESGADGLDPAGLGADGGQIGVAFTGKFDGDNHKIIGFNSDFERNEGATQPWQVSSYALVPFAYVGAGGVVENFTLDSASIRCGQSGSFVVGYNAGTVKNITIESNCTLFVHYGVAASAAATSSGTLQNIVCKPTQFDKMNDGTGTIENVVTTNYGEHTGCTIGEQEGDD